METQNRESLNKCSYAKPRVTKVHPLFAGEGARATLSGFAMLAQHFIQRIGQ
jgi:hypothetical protein